MPGMIYGPGDHSQAGAQIQQALDGKLPGAVDARPWRQPGHVEDIATGILLVHDRGSLGGEYLLGGEVATMRQVIQRAAALGGHPPPRFEVPPWLMRGAGVLGPSRRCCADRTWASWCRPAWA